MTKPEDPAARRSATTVAYYVTAAAIAGAGAAFLAAAPLESHDEAPVGLEQFNSSTAQQFNTVQDDDDVPVDFVRDIQPIFAQRCYKCHGPKRQESGLRLNSRQSVFQGGDSGEKLIVPGKPDESRLIKVINGTDPELVMPPPESGKPLAPEQIDQLIRWVRDGADWPETADTRDSGPSHWAWRQPTRASLPPVNRSDWPRSAMDYFVLARLEKEGLSPSPEADRYTLIRRVYLDLIGLPPSPQDVDAFVADTRPDAYERVVDRLLADPGFGERWARMWLDLARYADSKGYGSDPLRTIWRYRDWVIEAFNRNLPYDQFTIEQLAGDLLPPVSLEGGQPEGNPTQPDDSRATQLEHLIATAFHRNTMSNDEGGTDDEEFRVAAIKDRVDTTAQVWMGLTVGCAKCHSHKFDPITQREYYQFFAFFNQTEDADREDEQPKLPTPTRQQQVDRERLNAELAPLRQEFEKPSAELDAAQARWEHESIAQSGSWTVLEPVHLDSAAGTTLTKLPDQSIVAIGESPAVDTYKIAVTTALKGITALRLELLPHESLPRGGPGRQSPDGNFVLSELRVTTASRPDQSIAGRYVRIEVPGSQRILSLAEVQAFDGAENIALRGKASQSSTDYDGSANLAIDNNTNGHYFEAKSTTHTRVEDNPWWELDLGDSNRLNRVIVWNRTDGNLQHRLSNFRISVLDEARQPVWQAMDTEPPNPNVDFKVGAATEVRLQQATSDFDPDGWPIAKAIDGDAGPQSGWAAWKPGSEPPATSRPGERHVAVFQAAQPIDCDSGATITFTLAQAYGREHTLGRLRLSATTVNPPPRALPRPITAILAVAPDTRSADQKAELARYYRSIAPELQGLRDRMAQVEQQIKAIEKATATTPIMRELPPDKRRPTHVLIKSNFLAKGEPVDPVVPQAFHPMPQDAPTNRLGLAMWLVDRANPLTARVAVNRFWAQLFGRGLVETEEDFGTQGMPPSHPELLDWLAVEFMSPENLPSPLGGEGAGVRGNLPFPLGGEVLRVRGSPPSPLGGEGPGVRGSPPSPLGGEGLGVRGAGDAAGATRPWDIKRLLRLIVTSATYRQSSIATPELLQKDPDNHLLARGPRYRLEAEMVRDQALALAGLLSRKIGGPSVYPPQPPGLWRAAFNGDRTWPTSTGEDRYRRGLYTFWRRTVPYPSMATFDAPSREICTMRRISTNTPLQAFVTLNDPVYVEAAQALARRIVREGGASPEEHAAYGLRLCLARLPHAGQVEELVALYQNELEHYRQDSSAAQEMATDPLGPLPDGMDTAELAAWTVVSNVLLNLDGVLTKR